jgi:hypothetical protein
LGIYQLNSQNFSATYNLKIVNLKNEKLMQHGSHDLEGRGMRARGRSLSLPPRLYKLDCNINSFSRLITDVHFS